MGFVQIWVGEEGLGFSQGGLLRERVLRCESGGRGQRRGGGCVGLMGFMSILFKFGREFVFVVFGMVERLSWICLLLFVWLRN